MQRAENKLAGFSQDLQSKWSQSIRTGTVLRISRSIFMGDGVVMFLPCSLKCRVYEIGIIHHVLLL
jgi:hypothetical protein